MPNDPPLNTTQAPFGSHGEKTPEQKQSIGIWRYHGVAGGKYLIQRRDGSVPDWPGFVLGAKDAAAPVALRAYADECKRLGYAAQYVADVRRMADEFEAYAAHIGQGDPDAPPHRQDDPAIIAKMLQGGSG